ncbi:MAG: hypothetical protein Q4B50_02260 [Bacillota bacterium]|nr:hypothetical protein [Bacillota bacterium]
MLLLLLFLLLSLIFQPSLGYQAAERGLRLWWQVVLPALLPFFITSELLLGLGLAAKAGPGLAPLMGPLFHLPGSAALAVVMGFCSGFPSGAALAAGLYREKSISAGQAARLIAFCNNAGPLYLTVSLATGLLGCPPAALILLLSHYGSDLLLGFALGRAARLRGEPLPRTSGCRPLPQEEQALGSLLRAAARRACENLLLIGAYMVFFSVLTALLMAPLPALPSLLHSCLLGLFEMSLALEELAGSGLSLERLLPWAAAILSFGGLSVQAQVLAMLSGTEIRPGLYLLCRPLQAFLAFGLAGLLCHLLPLPLSAFSFSAQGRPFSLLAASMLLCLAAVTALFVLAFSLGKKQA